MSELLPGGFVADIDLAVEMAYSEKPGRDYLHDNPDLSRDEVIAVAYEIGAAALHTQRELQTDRGVWGDIWDPYVYRNVPKEELSLADSPLMEEWLLLPNMKVLNGRPVISIEDFRAFTRQQVASDDPFMYKGTGAEVWRLLDNAVDHETEYIVGHEYYAMQQLVSLLRYFDADTAQEAGLEPTEHLDLYSLYEFVSGALPTMKRGKKRWPFEISDTKVRFVARFLNQKLQLEEPFEV